MKPVSPKKHVMRYFSTRNTPKKRRLKTSKAIAKYQCLKRKLPKEVLVESLKVIKSPNDETWIDANKSCSPRIAFGINKELTISTEMSTKLKLARQCLLRRDWRNLARILTLNLFDPLRNTCVFPIFAKYGALCLFNTDQSLLRMFLQTIVSSNDFNEIMRICSTYNWQKETE